MTATMDDRTFGSAPVAIETLSKEPSIKDIVHDWIKRNADDRFNASLLATALNLTTQQVHSVLSQLNTNGDITRLGGGWYSPDSHEPEPKPQRKQAKRGTVIGPVREHVATLGGEPFHLTDVAKALGMASDKVNSAINNMKAQGEVKNVSKGVWISTAVQDWGKAVPAVVPEETTVDSGDMLEVVGHSNGRVLVRNVTTHEVYELRELP